MMVDSSWDMLVFVHVVQNKMKTVGGLIVRKRGASVDAIPEQRQKEMITARAVHNRFASGKYQHEPKEAGDLISLAQWLYEQHASLSGHPYRPPSIDPADFQAKSALTRPPEGVLSYRKAGDIAVELLHNS